MFSPSKVLSSKVTAKLLNLHKKFSSKLTAVRYGEPLDVLKLEKDEIVPPKDKEVLIEILAAPVNPVDINILQGKYPVEFPLPFVPGYEGVGRVLGVGKDVRGFNEGDHAVPLIPCMGTWRSYLTLSQEVLLKVPKELHLHSAATLICNTSTAYCMLKSFVGLTSEDTVIQNGANSACGQLVIQLCKLWGITSVNIVRNRENIEELKGYLKNLGATYVLTEEELRRTEIFKSKKVTKPKLALNCVGGKISSEIGRHLQPGGYHVTYGGMSMEPVTISTAALIFNDIHVMGFNMTKWIENKNNNHKREAMLKELVEFNLNKDLIVPKCVEVDLENYVEAINKTMSSSKELVRKKYVFRK